MDMIMRGKRWGRGGGRCPSVAVADVPDAPAATVGVSVAGLDCLQTLGAGVPLPTVAVQVVAVAGVPDFVRLVDGHGSFRFDGISLQGQGIWQAPGRTLL